MAARKTIEIVFKGVDEVSDVLGGVKDGFGRVDAVINNVAAPLAAVTDSVLAIDAALAALAVGGLAFAIRKSNEFENAQVELTKVLDTDVTESVEKARENAFALSNQYGISAAELLESTAEFKQSGFNLKEAFGLVEDSIKLQIAGSLDAATATEVVKRALNGFNSTAENAGRIIEIFNALSQKFSTNILELSTGFARLSGSAEGAGFTFEETAATLTPIIEVFGSGAEAANALKTVFAKLTDDAKPVREALERLGVSQKTANGAFRSGRDIFFDVGEALQQVDKNERAVLITQLVGINQTVRTQKVFSNWEKVLRAVAVAQEDNNTVQTEVNARLASAQVIYDRTIQSVNNLATVLGDKVRKASTDAATGFTTLTVAIQDAISEGTFDPIFDVINDFGADARRTFETIARNLPDALKDIDFDELIETVENLASAVSEFFEDIDISTPEGLGDAIQGVVDSLSTLGQLTTGIVEGFRPFIDTLVETISTLNDSDSKVVETTGKFLGVAKVIVGIGSSITGAILFIERTGIKMADVFKLVSGSILFVFETFRSAFLAAEDVIAQSITGILKGIRLITFGNLRRELDIMVEGWEDYSNAVLDARIKSSDNFFKGLQAAGEGFSGTLGSVTDKIESLPQKKRLDLVLFDEDFQNKFKGLTAELQRAGTIPITPKADVKATEKAVETIKVIVDGKEIDAVHVKAEKVKYDIDQAIPDKKTVKVEAKVDKGQVEAENKRLESLLKFRAEIEETKIQEKTKRIEAGFESLNNTFETAAGAVADISETITTISGKDIDINVDIETGDKLEDSFEAASKSVVGLGKAFGDLVAKGSDDFIELAEAPAEVRAEFAKNFRKSTDVIQGALKNEVNLRGGILDLERGKQRLVQNALNSEFSLRNRSLNDELRNNRLRRRAIREQLQIQQAAFVAQQKLTEEQIKGTIANTALQQAKLDAIASGEGLINIQADGLEPELEAFMFKILEKIQIRANEEQAEFLLGVGV